MSLFRRIFKRNTVGGLAPEERFVTVFNIVKELPRSDFKKLMDGIDLAWQGYDKALRVQTREEKENADIYMAERELER